MTEITEADLAALSALDTPTVCNALELVVPHRRAYGFNRHPLVCPSANAGRVNSYYSESAKRSVLLRKVLERVRESQAL